MKRQAEQEQRDPAGAQEIAAIVRSEAPDSIHRVLRDELQPIVREALTEDVLRSIEKMVGLTPRAVELLSQDLESEDSTIRQRAYTLIAKYTWGHPALVRPDDAGSEKQIVVNFALPRPDAEAIEASVDEVTLVECDLCHADKPAAEMVAGSTRCFECFKSYRDEVIAQYGEQ